MNKHSLGLGTIILLGMNSVLGTGIFFLPSKAMALVGPASIYVYILATLAAIAIAFCFAECATLFSRNGAAYVYAKEAFGDFIGFQVGIMRWFSTMLAGAALVVGWVTLVEHFLPCLFSPCCHAIMVVSTIVGLALVNVYGIHMFSLINNLAASAKLLLLSVFAVIGSFYIDTTNFSPMVPDYVTYDDVGAAVMVVFFAFSGFEGLAVATEEMENPKRNIPIALFIVLFLTSLIYLTIHSVLIGILGDGLGNTMLPIAKAAHTFAGDNGEFAVLICMSIASLGSNVAASFSAPRSAVALAQDGMLPKAMAKFGRFGTPSIAIAVTAVFTSIIALSGSFTALASMSVFIRLIQYFPTCLAVLVFRFGRPDVQSTFSPFFGTIIPIAALVIIVWMAMHATPEAIVFGVIGILGSIPLYFIQKQKRNALS